MRPETGGAIVTYNSHAAGAGVLQEIEAGGGKAVALELDVAKVASFAAFRDKVATALATTWDRDRFDALINNAGYGQFSAIEAVTEAEFDGLLGVHLKGSFFLTHALLPLVADGGQIVNMTNAMTRVATSGAAPYAACKGRLGVLTRYMSTEFGPRGIRASSISPGAIRTRVAAFRRVKCVCCREGFLRIGLVSLCAERLDLDVIAFVPVLQAATRERLLLAETANTRQQRQAALRAAPARTTAPPIDRRRESTLSSQSTSRAARLGMVIRKLSVEPCCLPAIAVDLPSLPSPGSRTGKQ